MKGVKPISMKQDEAKLAWKEYRNGTKFPGGFTADYNQLNNLYRHLSKGRKVIDIRECFKKAGLNNKNQPRLAIASIGFGVRHIRCTRGQGSMTFALSKKGNDSWDDMIWKARSYIEIPYTMPPIPPIAPDQPARFNYPNLFAKIPIVPPRFLPHVKNLREYFVLWEVKDWAERPKDPLLLRRISDWAFVVLGAWDITPLERMFL